MNRSGCMFKLCSAIIGDDVMYDFLNDRIVLSLQKTQMRIRRLRDIRRLSKLMRFHQFCFHLGENIHYFLVFCRLDEIMANTCGHCLPRIFELPVGADQNHPNRKLSRLYFLGQFNSGHLGHLDVAKDDVNRMIQQILKSVETVVQLFDNVE